MKKGKVLVLILLILICASLIYFFTRDSKLGGINLTGNAIYSHPSSLNCTNQNIIAKWNALFQEPSTNLRIIVNESNNCSEFRAFKNKSNQFFILAGYSLPISGINISFNSSQIYAFKGNISSDLATNFSSMLSNESIPGIWILLSVALAPYENITTITSSFGADTEFRSVFKITVPSYEAKQQDGQTYYNFYDNMTVYKSSTIDLQEGSMVSVAANHSLVMFGYQNSTISSCSPIWTQTNMTCNETTNNLTAWFNDSNNCKAFFPANNYVAPENLTLSCAASSDLLHGNQDSVTKVNLGNLSIYVNNIPLNDTQIYRENLPLEFKENSTTLISLTYNFSLGLNFSEIKIEKQNSTSLFSYLIISGLDVSKTAYLDKIDAASNAVCIKDATISSISEISPLCDAASELIVPCPGSNSTYNCAISGSRFSISGLAHSAVKEASQSASELSCIASWNCTEWSLCMNGNQIRTCVDANNCNNLTVEPLELQACVAPCSPNWICGNWSSCGKNGNQTRLCTDSNSCGIPDGKPSELQVCASKSSKSGKSILPHIIIGLVILIILVAITMLILYLIKSNKKGYDPANSPSAKLGPVTPPGVDNVKIQ
ncbi:MAG: hypothetical protein Q8Q31_00385 [Nanoarchaeota archaeon]|nr:hypothetical protein [Nanoarchaeota archaeon]